MLSNITGALTFTYWYKRNLSLDLGVKTSAITLGYWKRQHTNSIIRNGERGSVCVCIPFIALLSLVNDKDIKKARIVRDDARD